MAGGSTRRTASGRRGTAELTYYLCVARTGTHAWPCPPSQRTQLLKAETPQLNLLRGRKKRDNTMEDNTMEHNCTPGNIGPSPIRTTNGRKMATISRNNGQWGGTQTPNGGSKGGQRAPRVPSCIPGRARLTGVSATIEQFVPRGWFLRTFLPPFSLSQRTVTFPGVGIPTPYHHSLKLTVTGLTCAA